MTIFSNPVSLIIFLVSLLVAITIHEFAHAAVADYLGDPTPRLTGRLTLNPFAHLDPLGTLMLFLFRFGWGKPVPIDPFNLRRPRRDQALISLAGPASNLILAAFLSLLLHLGGVIASPFASLRAQSATSEVFSTIILLNIALAIFNLLPVYPLDGFKIVLGFLPPDLASQWEELRPYGFPILFLLIFPFFGHSLISLILSPIINWLLKILLPGGYTLI